MNTLKELWSNKSGDINQQRLEDGLERAIARSRMHFVDIRALLDGGPLSPPTAALVVGIATYSGHDLQLLAILDEVLDMNPSISVEVIVFSIATLTSSEQLEGILPGIGITKTTPIVAEFVDGRVNSQAFGWNGRELLRNSLEASGGVHGIDRLVKPLSSLERW